MTVKEIKKEIAELKATDKLHKAVINDIINEAEYYNGNSIERIYMRCSDVSHGCQTGIVGSLVYYSQTTAFFKKYESEIADLVSEAVSGFGMSLGELFKDWDNNDPFARDLHNRNLLAWFAYEEINYKLMHIVEQY